MKILLVSMLLLSQSSAKITIEVPWTSTTEKQLNEACDRIVLAIANRDQIKSREWRRPGWKACSDGWTEGRKQGMLDAANELLK